MRADDEHRAPSGRASALGNDFGLSEAVLGLCVGFVLSVVASSVVANLSSRHRPASLYGQDVASLLALWVGLLGACVLALSTKTGGASLRSAMAARFGLRFRPLVDLPLGIAVGVGAQLLLVPLLDLPLQPFVPHLSQRLGQPAHQLTDHVSGPGLVILGVLVCLGSPLVEELFFRGLLLRGLLGRFQHARSPLGPATAIVVCGVLFGLAHFEALQLLALCGFGTVLGVLAYRSGRLGPGIVAHIAFNSTTFIALAWTH